ncbi:bifunctional phosphopantothenoylcysteine decarboxylase/phosphopantothenate--cysteine ligase CoaBC [Arthrobacter agilis]|uniref:bifunctional phosphopantothenoylcysteine decarboxylase/phosphopantothenate--cysteine ligase CoaBC n=1 Tax=Arthrobacter agilis TaxID=37921 RepID=UPI000B34BCFE|nr:bifunctional phosphopantothenoylcysteine decarboxylase/phosphopantothenate--cysteine ligase CoaBC [Arthrobacter agilis]OUM45233.1 phosphopantothenoylcysteine decarboxylase [Arthrobacter agilis]PPB47503.1 bifunctional phosphopantothenoylcysteine decarboxylase/phosphopantothenate--cysteine ligase CoaBC [Arthrobacter agilis]TPV21719.1 bifunctional phosphopantothenoylcysteine decarboxylase/phosphopantothenate--cysteine ligase CoaBC [Arthrobacter agilis]VDR32168.1 DNA/pantothenate metabolism flav
MRIVLGVGGGIAAYKAASLLRLFTEAGHDVTVIPTDAATRFVGTATWEALSGHPVSNSVWDDVDRVNHVRLGHEAELIVVAPATADVLARAAAGLANDLLTGTLLMARGPVVMAPAMHTEMWQHAATRANVETLRARGVIVLEPASGRLTGSDSGPGRLPEPADIFAAALAATAVATGDAGPMTGKRVTISAGGTREALDPVRFLGNRSSGKQGMALAEAALAQGAHVTLILAHAEVPPPAGCDVVRVDSALQLRDAVLDALPTTDVLVMAAAVADFRPAEMVATKIKKTDDGADPVITLVRNPDVLREAVVARASLPGPLVIAGFAAETGDSSADPITHARAKLARKGCDLLVLNVVGADLVFGEDSNEVTILSADGSEAAPVRGSKRVVADAVMEHVARLIAH